MQVFLQTLYVYFLNPQTVLLVNMQNSSKAVIHLLTVVHFFENRKCIIELQYMLLLFPYILIYTYNHVALRGIAAGCGRYDLLAESASFNGRKHRKDIVGQEPVDKSRTMFAHEDVTTTFLTFHARSW